MGNSRSEVNAKCDVPNVFENLKYIEKFWLNFKSYARLAVLAVLQQFES